MAETIKLQVELENKISQSKQIASELKSQGGFKGNSKAEQSVALITQELESLAKISNPTLKNLSRIEVLFDQLSEILLKIAQTTKTTTEEFKKIEKELANLQSKESELKKRRSALFKEGRVNKDSGKYELYNTYQDEVVAKAGIKNAKGVDIKRSSTFLSKFDETGNPIQGAFQDPVAAKKIYDELLATQTKNADELREINETLATYKIKIEQKTQELEGQGQSENNTLPSKIISNKTQVNRLIDSEKEQIHSEEDQKKLTTSIEGTTTAIQKQTSSLGRAFKQFTIYNVAVKAVRMALNEAKQTIKELDKYLTEQAMVTGKTREQTYKLIDSYQSLALQCGATTKEIAEVATEYMKQGKTIEDSLVLTEAAVKAAKVARVSVGDSVNYLTTALNGFRLEADQAMAVSDKFAALAAASATDYDELAIALSKVASQANLAGMSMDYTTALLTKGLETTREAPETMGTALKTIIARMRELGDFGETLEGDTDINNVEKQLKYVDIALRDTSGELRSTEDVLDELGKKWDTLSKNQQAAVAKALAGTRQQSRLIAMMEDYERVTELQEISQRSAGATAAQAGVFLKGMEASLNNIQVAWEKIVMTLTDSKIIIGTLDIAGKALDKIGDSLKDTRKQVGLFTTLATIGALMLGNKLREHDIAKQENKLALERSIIEQKAAIEKRQNFIDNSTQILKDQQEQEIKKANNEIILAQEKELGLQEEHNKAVAAEAAAEQKAAQADLTAQKHEQNAADAKIIADAENAHAVTLEMEAAEAKSTAQAAEKHQIELESLKVKLQEKALTEEGLSAQEQALLNNIDNEIALSKEKEKEARNQAKYASIQAEAARDVAKDADNEYKKRQKTAKLQRGKADSAKKELDSAKKLTKATADNLNNAKKITAEKEKNLTDLQATHKKQLEDNASQVETAKQLLKLDEEKLNLLYEQQGGLMAIFGLWNKLKGLVLLFKPIYAGILFFQKLINKEKNKEYVATLRQQAAEAKGFRKKLMNAGAAMAESVGANPFWGWAAAIAILAAIGISIGVAVSKQNAYKNSADGTADSINKMSNKIYELTQKSNALNEIVNKFEDIDNQVIKTTADIEEMNSLLSSAGDNLSTERKKDNKGEEIEGTSEQDIYNGMEDQYKKLQYIQGKAEDAKREADQERQKALDEINDLKNRDYAEYKKMINDETSNGKYLSVQSSIKQTAREHAYDQIDKLKEDFKNEGRDIDSLQDVESLVSSLVSKMSSEDALEYANDAKKMQALVNSLASKDAALATDTFLDEGKGIKERIDAYNQLKETLKDNDVALNALKASYNEFEELSKNWTPGVINLIDREKLSIKAINDLYDSYEILQKEGVKITQEAYKTSMDNALSQLEPGMANLEEVLKNNFASMLSDGEDFNDQWDILLNQFANTFTKTALDIGQSLTKFNNTTNDFYEKSLKWGEMNQSERMEFINDNADLFTDDPQTEVDEGAELLKAFQTGDYRQLEESLKTQMEKRRQEELESVNELLEVEKLKKNNKNTALIAELEAQKAYLEDTDNLYKANLELQLEQQQKQLDEYRGILEKEKEALTESLEKRKEAYEKYFDEISKKEEDAEYEEERDKLVTNIAKLASSGDADAKAKTMELEQQLKELEAERLQTLKERAREAILENMDNEVEEINDKFDKLLENEQALLMAMQGELENPTEFLTKMIGNKFMDGATELQLEDFVNSLELTYGSSLDGVDWDAIREEVIEQLFLNVNGQDVYLNESDQQSVFKAVKKALQEIGKR